jgi:hypothetical protein
MTDDRTEVVLPGGTDDEKKRKYRETIARTRKNLELTKPGSLPNFADADKPVAQSPGMARPFGKEEFSRMVEEGQPMVHGIGSGYAANQALAGAPIDPDRVTKRQETEDGLRALAEAQAQAQADGPLQPASPQPVPEDTAPEPIEEPIETPEEKTLEETLESLPRDEQAALLAEIKNRRRNVLRREEIEGRLTPLDLGTVLTTQDAIQDVPVVPDELVLTLRGLSGHEDSFAKDWSWRETTNDSSNVYYQTRLYLMTAVLCVTKINGRPIMDHRGEDGRVDEKKFQEKMVFMLRYPMPLLAEIAANYAWFEDRVRDLFDYESVKNG